MRTSVRLPAGDVTEAQVADWVYRPKAPFRSISAIWRADLSPWEPGRPLVIDGAGRIGRPRLPVKKEWSADLCGLRARICADQDRKESQAGKGGREPPTRPPSFFLSALIRARRPRRSAGHCLG